MKFMHEPVLIIVALGINPVGHAQTISVDPTSSGQLKLGDNNRQPDYTEELMTIKATWTGPAAAELAKCTEIYSNGWIIRDGGDGNIPVDGKEHSIQEWSISRSTDSYELRWKSCRTSGAGNSLNVRVTTSNSREYSFENTGDKIVVGKACSAIVPDSIEIRGNPGATSSVTGFGDTDGTLTLKGDTATDDGKQFIWSFNGVNATIDWGASHYDAGTKQWKYDSKSSPNGAKISIGDSSAAGTASGTITATLTCD